MDPINNEDQEAPWSQNPWRKDTIALTEKYELEKILPLVTICMNNHFASSVMALKMILIYV